jgi:hypothetical protein
MEWEVEQAPPPQSPRHPSPAGRYRASCTHPEVGPHGLCWPPGCPGRSRVHGVRLDRHALLDGPCVLAGLGMDGPCERRANHCPDMTAASPLLELADDAPTSEIEVARRWALSLGLRSGVTRCFQPGALLPLAERWATERGWAPPTVTSIGVGLAAAGVRLWRGKERRLLLHRDDAARLRELVWEAWAPRVPPGERPRRKEQRLPLQCALGRLAYLERKRTEPAPTFHAQLAREGGLSRATPVVDSRGRVYPTLTYAARALVGKRLKDKAPAQLTAAMRRDGHWHGLVWRRLLPGELEMIPHDAACGARIEALSWQCSCQQQRLLTLTQFDTVRIGAVARDDEREG